MPMTASIIVSFFSHIKILNFLNLLHDKKVFTSTITSNLFTFNVIIPNEKTCFSEMSAKSLINLMSFVQIVVVKNIYPIYFLNQFCNL